MKHLELYNVCNLVGSSLVTTYIISCFVAASVDVSEDLVIVKLQPNVDGELQYKLDDEASFSACKLFAKCNYI